MDAKSRAIWDYAVEKYQNDPDFHARVEQAVNVLKVSKYKDVLYRETATGIRAVVSLSLAMNDVDPVTGEINAK